MRVRLSARDSLWSTHIIKLVQGARGHRAALRQPLAGAEGAVVMLGGARRLTSGARSLRRSTRRKHLVVAVARDAWPSAGAASARRARRGTATVGCGVLRMTDIDHAG